MVFNVSINFCIVKLVIWNINSVVGNCKKYMIILGDIIDFLGLVEII